MATLTISISMDNAAFTDPETGDPDPYTAQAEVGRILKTLAKDVEENGIRRDTSPIFDINGARVGWAQVER